MKSNTQKIKTNDIQYVIDKQGNRIFVQIPLIQWEMIQSALAYDSDTTETTELPEIVDKQGILVVRAKPLRDLANVTRDERNRRVFELLQRVGI